LIAEDQALVAMDIEQQLRALNYDVVAIASTAEEVIFQAARLQPDLALLDIHLSGSGDGIAAAAAIRLRHGTPVVFLTAYSDSATLNRAREVEPYGYLVKPFTDRDLHTTIQVALSKARNDRMLRRNRDDLQAILDTQRQGTVLIDSDHRAIFVSRTAREILAVELEPEAKPEWQALFAVDEAAKQQIACLLAAPAGTRNKILVTVGGANDRQTVLEVEVQDDPRKADSRILFLYDVSQIMELRRQLDDKAHFELLVGKSKPMEEVFHLIRDLSQVDATVLVDGATGTGKELVARAIHNLSHRRDKPFLAFNCAGLNEELAASQLFGHRRGAFTGAVDDQIGLFEAAGGGTLFLDEIGELSMRIQTMLLRTLEERQIMRLGESRMRPVQARIITATNRDLLQEVANHRFRADLLYRIRVARIELPALAARREDIPLLARAFVAQHSAALGKRVVDIDDESLVLLMSYDWPGNVRELKNALEFAVIRARNSSIKPVDLPPEIGEAVRSDSLLSQLSSDDREGLLQALERAGGNRKEAAHLLGISRATLYRRLTQFGCGSSADNDPSEIS
jgi:DNA-binding NtrC family response regulator